MSKTKPGQLPHPASEIDLPEGWAGPLVRDVLDVRYGKGLPERNRKDGIYAVYGSNGVVGHHDEPLTAGPTIILGRKGTVGRVHYSRQPCWPIDTTFFVEEVPGLDMGFLYHALSTLGLSVMDTSSAIPGLNRENVFAQVLPLAPLPEQQRIVVKVEVLLERVNAARARLARLPAILKRFRQSVLAAACSGQLTAGWRESVAPWQETTVSSVCEQIVDCPHSTPKWTETGEVCLRTTNFRPGRLDLSEVRYVSRDTFKSRISRLEPAAGDVLYSREGGILGVACLFPAGLRACLGQRMMLMRAGPQLRPTYLMYLLNSPRTQDEVRGLTGGTASPHLNVGDVKEFIVPLPPLLEQDEIIRRVDALLALADGIEGYVRAATVRAARLPQAILARALHGELVHTEAELATKEGRDYEPASVLLERIQETSQKNRPASGKRWRGGKEMARRSTGRQAVKKRRANNGVRLKH